jgi:hypothetical protein
MPNKVITDEFGNVIYRIYETKSAVKRYVPNERLARILDESGIDWR